MAVIFRFVRAALNSSLEQVECAQNNSFGFGRLLLDEKLFIISSVFLLLIFFFSNSAWECVMKDK